MSKKIILFLASFFVFFNTQAAVDTTWLIGQQGSDGRFMANNDLGYPVQNTSEALQTLYALDDINLVNENLGLQIIDASDSIHLENIVRKIFANKNANQDTASLIIELKSFINFDGGFGSIVDYQSTVLDTALATQAWATSNALLGDDFGYAIGYLSSRQNADGSWSSAGNESSLYVTALVSLALQKAQAIYNVTDNINAANNYLLNTIQREGVTQREGVRSFHAAFHLIS